MERVGEWRLHCVAEAVVGQKSSHDGTKRLGDIVDSLQLGKVRGTLLKGGHVAYTTRNEEKRRKWNACETAVRQSKRPVKTRQRISSRTLVQNTSHVVTRVDRI